MEKKNTIPDFMRAFADHVINDYQEALGTGDNKYTDYVCSVLSVYERGLITIREAMYLISRV